LRRRNGLIQGSEDERFKDWRFRISDSGSVISDEGFEGSARGHDRTWVVASHEAILTYS